MYIVTFRIIYISICVEESKGKNAKCELACNILILCTFVILSDRARSHMASGGWGRKQRDS
jgi:hypothetical protein